MALDIESSAVRHNTQTFNRGRYEATAVIPNYDALKDQARAIKEAAIAQLPELLPKLEASVKRNGGHFFLAKDGKQASHYITQLCRERQVRLVVKGKSMTGLPSQSPPLHIAIAGIEKVLPRRAALAPFIELLAPSATGQGLSSYPSVLTPPLTSAPLLSGSGAQREFHLVLVDNG